METMTRPEIAHLLDVHPKTVEKLEREGLPVAVVGSGGRGNGTRYDAPEVVRWWTARATERRLAEVVRHGEYDAQEELGRLRHHQANIAALDEAERERRLLDTGEVTRQLSQLMVTMRSTFLALPVRLAQVAFGGADVREIEHAARVEIERALTEFADGADFGEPVGEDEPAAYEPA